MSDIKELLTQEWYEELIEEVNNSFQKKVKTIKELYMPELVELAHYQKKMLGDYLSFPFKNKLSTLFSYARGDKGKPVNADKILDKAKDLVWENEFLPNKNFEISRSDWEETKLGLLVSIVEAKIKYDNQDKMTPKEIGLLKNISGNAIRRRIDRNTLKAKKVRGKYYIEPEEYNKIINL